MPSVENFCRPALPPSSAIEHGGAQILALFNTLRVNDEKLCVNFTQQFRKAANWDQQSSAARANGFRPNLTIQVRNQQQDLLLDLRLLEETDAKIYATRAPEIRRGRPN